MFFYLLLRCKLRWNLYAIAIGKFSKVGKTFLLRHMGLDGYSEKHVISPVVPTEHPNGSQLFPVLSHTANGSVRT